MQCLFAVLNCIDIRADSYSEALIWLDRWGHIDYCLRRPFFFFFFVKFVMYPCTPVWEKSRGNFTFSLVSLMKSFQTSVSSGVSLWSSACQFAGAVLILSLLSPFSRTVFYSSLSFEPSIQSVIASCHFLFWTVSQLLPSTPFPSPLQSSRLVFSQGCSVVFSHSSLDHF